MDVTVRIDHNGDIEVVVSDETGYSPDLCETMLREARDCAVAAYQDMHAQA